VEKKKFSKKYIGLSGGAAALRPRQAVGPSGGLAASGAAARSPGRAMRPAVAAGYARVQAHASLHANRGTQGLHAGSTPFCLVNFVAHIYSLIS